MSSQRSGHGVEIMNLQDVREYLANGLGVDVHGAPARGFAVHSNGHLGCDVLAVKAGDQFPIHTHPGDHLLQCLSGIGTITVAGVTYRVKPGDIYMVEGLVPHAVGAETDHVLLAIGSPHKAIDSPERMTFVDWDGQRVDTPLPAETPVDGQAHHPGTPTCSHGYIAPGDGRHPDMSWCPDYELVRFAEQRPEV